MLPQRSIIPDPELSQDARREPVRVPLAGPGKFDDPARDEFGFVISRTDGKVEPRARSIERLAHGFNVLGLESEGLGSRFWHRGIYQRVPRRWRGETQFLTIAAALHFRRG